MKVAINRVMGCSFGLSDKAIDAYVRRSETPIYRYSDEDTFMYRSHVYSTVDLGIPEDSIIDDSHRILLFAHPEYPAKGIWDSRRIDRNDPILIDIIETMGKDACGGFMEEFTIVEIPDDVEYWIIRHDDGTEHIAERHRTWP